jgi:phosphotransferase system IIB component
MSSNKKIAKKAEKVIEICAGDKFVVSLPNKTRRLSVSTESKITEPVSIP